MLQLILLACIIYANGQNTEDSFRKPQQDVLNFGANLTSIFFIGDLHGDIDCARYWVERTNLINISSVPYTWIGENQSSKAIVFLGDYVDKGTTSRTVLEFVKTLHESFPANVLPMLGNHDLYMLLDATLEVNFAKNHHPMGQMAHDFSYAFINPEEYVTAGFSPSREDDDLILTALHDALEWVYARDAYSRVFLCPSHNPNSSTCHEDQIDLFSTASPFAEDIEFAMRARTRLQEWRTEYATGLLNSGLLLWLGRLPIVAIVGDALVMHGGMSLQVLNYVEQRAKLEEVAVQEAFNELTNSPFHAFWSLHLSAGAQGEQAMMTQPNTITNIPEIALSLIQELVTYRGYFKDKNEPTIKTILSKFNLNRIVVGHTPHDFATEYYEGILLATDSTLSRAFRAYGNLYCPVRDNLQKAGVAKLSDCARLKNDACEGTISHLQRKSSSDPWPKHVVEVNNPLESSVLDEL